MASNNSPVLSVTPHSGGPWKTHDPFIFCVHHLDNYPAGQESMGPDPKLLNGRDLGMDFSAKNGWSMYHGEVIPGFPRHPHRGFETVTIVRQGLIDHADSLGATARFGSGDTQWVTTGSGVCHSEMFPLVKKNEPNPLELFQLWLNLPAKSKMTPAFFTMLWKEKTPVKIFTDASGRKTSVQVVAGQMDGVTPLPPPPGSWASDQNSNLAIWSISLEEGASWTLPPAIQSKKAPARTLHVFSGKGLTVAGQQVLRNTAMTAVQLNPYAAGVELVASQGPVEILMLQAVPIEEPVAQRGPFVMNTQKELMEAYSDYQRTGFGGWTFDSDAPAHKREQERFARHADGRIENPAK